MKTILILEDDIDLANHWQTWLEEAGYRVLHESDAAGAVAIVDSIEVDLVISDIFIGSHETGFSKQGGLSLLSHIMLHSDPKPKSMILTGAKPSIALNRHVELLEADRFIAKPVTRDTLLQEAKELLAQPKRSSHLPPEPL
ncbi:DNA-binding transcriptional regulator TorR [Polystyrenella longa]|uniref:DNA-binding transcriptional regulator TorR n=1 Tax=Polystyrenella longa TaxID=2528007 RepID=A0A518CLD1_9PLAN|nr:response regulator [Polystyrenella longa]QDU80035.1 DNA-binding transcriptional regulator TorR [Polystyrenella longa]